MEGWVVLGCIRNLSVTGRWFTVRMTISVVVGGARPCALKITIPVVGARHSKKNA